jgi:hypothetical protein
MITIGHLLHAKTKDGTVCCMMFIDCLMFDVYGIEIPEHISRIRTEHLPNNTNTQQKNKIEQ